MHFNYQGHSASGGIYQIKNTKNDKVYIGSAGKFSVRWTQHQKSLEKGVHANKHLQSAFNLDGPSVWHFTILEVVVGDKVARKAAEQIWIDKFYGENCYNFMKKAAASREDIPSKDPEITSKKLSEASKKMWQNQEYREGALARLQDPKKSKNALNALKNWQRTNHNKISETTTKQWEALKSDPEKYAEFQELRRQQAIKMHADPQKRANITEGHSDPAVRKLMSEKKKQQLKDNPEYYANAKRLLDENRLKAQEARRANNKAKLEKAMQENPNFLQDKKDLYNSKRRAKRAAAINATSVS